MIHGPLSPPLKTITAIGYVSTINMVFIPTQMVSGDYHAYSLINAVDTITHVCRGDSQG